MCAVRQRSLWLRAQGVGCGCWGARAGAEGRATKAALVLAAEPCGSVARPRSGLSFHFPHLIPVGGSHPTRAPTSLTQIEEHPSTQAPALVRARAQPGPCIPPWPESPGRRRGAFFGRARACEGSHAESRSTVTNTRICLENSIDLFDSWKSWGFDLNKKNEQGLLERAWTLD